MTPTNPLPVVAYRIAAPKKQPWLLLATDGAETYIRCNDGRWYRRDAEGMSCGRPIALWIVGEGNPLRESGDT